MAPKARTLTVYLAADTRRAKKDMQGFSGFLRSDFVRGVALAGAAMGAFSIAADSVGAALDELKQVGQLENLLGNLNLGDQTEQLNRWVDATQAATGVTDTELRGALTRLIPITKSARDAQALLTLAMDAAAGSGKPLASVVEAIGKAASGSSTALVRMFPQLRAVDGAADNASIAFRALNEQFSGSTAANADSIAGKIDRIKIAVDEAREAFGLGLLGIDESDTSGLDDILRKTEDLKIAAENWGKVFGTVLGGIVEGAEILRGTIVTLTTAQVQQMNTYYNMGVEVLDFFGLISDETAQHERETQLAIQTAQELQAQYDILGYEFGQAAEAIDTATNSLQVYAEAAINAANKALLLARSQGTLAEALRYTALAGSFGRTPSTSGGNLREWQEARREAERQEDALRGVSSASTGLSAAQQKLNAQLERARKQFQNSINTLKDYQRELDVAVQAYNDFYDTINGSLTKDNSIQQWFDDWKAKQEDFVAARKELSDAIAAADRERIEAATQALAALGPELSLDQYVAKQAGDLQLWSKALEEIGRNIPNTYGGQLLVEQFATMGSNASREFLIAYANGAPFSQWFTEVIPNLTEILTNNAQAANIAAIGLAGRFYGEGVQSAAELVEGMTARAEQDAEKYAKLGRRVGKDIGRGIKEEIAKAFQEALDGDSIRINWYDVTSAQRELDRIASVSKLRLGR